MNRMRTASSRSASRAAVMDRSAPLRWPLLAMAVVVLLTTVAVVRADDIRMGQFWIRDVKVVEVEGNTIWYVNSAGAEIEGEIGDLTGMHLDAYPKLKQADEAMEAGRSRQAVELLADVHRSTRQDWLKRWAEYRMLPALDASDQALAAARLYAQMVEAGAPLAYLTSPPLDAVGKASDEQRRQIVEVLDGALENVDGTRQRAVRRYLERVRALIGSGSTEGGDGPTLTNRLIVPVVLDRGERSTELLTEGKYAEAAEVLEQEIEEASTDELAPLLHKRGLAQLGQAEASGDMDQYRDAGLSFMRVVIHFPNSRVMTPSLIESAYVHHKLGRNDQAKRLLEIVDVRLGSRNEDPAMYDRAQWLKQATASSG